MVFAATLARAFECEGRQRDACWNPTKRVSFAWLSAVAVSFQACELLKPTHATQWCSLPPSPALLSARVDSVTRAGTRPNGQKGARVFRLALLMSTGINAEARRCMVIRARPSNYSAACDCRDGLSFEFLLVSTLGVSLLCLLCFSEPLLGFRRAFRGLPFHTCLLRSGRTEQNAKHLLG